MVPHSRRCRIWQSANILGDCCVCRRWEWGTMAANVGHLSHDVSTDVVGLLWVVSYVGTCKVMYQAIGNAYPTRWRWASQPALELLAWQSLHQIGCYAASSGKGHWGGMMHDGGGSEIGGRGTGCDNSYNRQVRTLINHGGRRCPIAAMGPHSWLLSIQQSTNILWNRSTLLKLEKTIINNVY